MNSNASKSDPPVKSVSEILGIEPKEIASLIKTGYFYYEQGRMKEARILFEGISVLDNLNPYVHGILGSIYQKVQKYDEAVNRYTLALNLYHEDIQVLTNRGEVYLHQGKLMEAAYDFHQAINLDANQDNPAANRARFLSILTHEALIAAAQENNQQEVNQLNA